MRYCQHCLLPDTRPGLHILGDGICNACHSHRTKAGDIDWNARREAFEKVVARAKQLSQGYDCLIPVSGGKDSTWQVVRCLEYGLNPLAVTWKTPARTALGQQNLDNLVRLGVDHIDYQVNLEVEKRFMLAALERFGTTALPMHMALHNIPITIAVKWNIPLIVWGENSADEYGGEDSEKGALLDSRWRARHGVTHGTTAVDWVGKPFTRKELTPYFGPSDAELENHGVRAVFLGYFFPWDPAESLRVATQHGFQIRQEGPKLGLYNFADIDDDFISIHHYIKWYKFGITRLFDNLSLEIRNGRMSREEALQTLARYGEQRPDEDIEKFCAFVGISRKRFDAILENFRNPDIWQIDNGTWKIPGFILPNWNWSV